MCNQCALEKDFNDYQLLKNGGQLSNVKSGASELPWMNSMENDSTPKRRTESKDDTLASLKSEYESLKTEEAKLNDELERLRNLSTSSASVEAHMEALHKYNEIKDIAQMVLGALAVQEGVTVKSLHEKYDLPTD